MDQLLHVEICISLCEVLDRLIDIYEVLSVALFQIHEK